MKPSPFEYHRPSTVSEAVGLLADLEDSKVLAGGQSLVPLMNFRLAAPAHLVDITGIAELDRIEVAHDAVTVGAAVTHAALLAHSSAGQACPLLHHSLRHVAHAVIRNRGTVCGSIAHADPAAEMPAVVAVLGAEIDLQSKSGLRTVAGDEFFTSTFESVRRDDELLTAVRFPVLSESTATSFVEIARRHGDYAMCGAAAVVDLDGSVITGARLGYIAMASVPVVIDVSDTVAQRRPDQIDRQELYAAATDRVDPSGDLHASADYRRHLAGVLAGDAVAAALADAEVSL